MNRYYLMLKTGLQVAATNVLDFMLGRVRPFGDEVEIREDLVYESLVEQSEYDNEYESFLSVILVALAKYVNRKFEDFLPGGIYSDPSDELKSKVGSVEKHNKFSERIFAYFDNLLRFKPHINTLASEAYITFSVNRTGELLSTKSEEESSALVEAARKEVSVIMKNFKERQENIKEHRR